MRAHEFNKPTLNETTLGGFPVKVLHIKDQEVDEAEITQGNFSRRSPYAKQDMDIPMYDPKSNRAWNPAYSGDNPQEAFDHFETEPVGRTSAHINGVTRAGKKIKIATTTAAAADALVNAYNRGGFSDQSIERVDLKKAFKPDEPAPTKPDLRLVKEAKSLAKKVRVVKGEHAGKIGWIREIKHGLFKGAPKTYFVDLEDGTQVNNVPGTALRLVKDPEIAEAIKLDAPHRKMSRDELQGYADRIKSGTKTKKDRFAPIVHASNIKGIVNSKGQEWDLDDLAQQIMQRPRAILGTNAKMAKSATEGEIVYDLTLPALSGIVVDEETGDFVEITTCPSAGECQLFCYARKGGYVMFPASSISAAQSLNFLVNDPKGYMDRVRQEIQSIKAKADKHGIKLVVRWHDAGDFFSKEYLNLAFDVARDNPDVDFYAYTKMADIATADKPDNFIINFSQGAKRREEKKIEQHREKTGAPVKSSVIVPKDMFFDLIARQGNKLIKDEKGRTQFKNQESLDEFKQRLASKYHVPLDSIITYDQMLSIPPGKTPKWNVIVQPGAGDRAANRHDVIHSFLMYH